ncbi:MAG: STAS-like domain-containing protein [Vibrio sp.]|uniref:STAS-like domain-containing protein n=1 Tax=Vibrio sp. TaxID=678 RepID=UPI003A835E56
MSTNKKTEFIRNQILQQVKNGNTNPATHIGESFGMTRQAVNRHIKALVDERKLISSGTTRSRVYSIGPIRDEVQSIKLDGNVAEDLVYRKYFSWVTDDLPSNVEGILFYGFTEMVNNVIDHSEGRECIVNMHRDTNSVTLMVMDDGEGIFKRIARLCHLIDERQAILELSKGKLTTDPENHSGQGIFFTSRMFDDFVIESKGLRFDHHHNQSYDYLNEKEKHDFVEELLGTWVGMRISIDSSRTELEVFTEYTASEDDDYAFNKTVIPVKLAQFGQEQLVSRSQAKRLLARIENFKHVIFDFEDVKMIGQAFADQIFRVYRNMNPDIHIRYRNAAVDVENMIKRAESEI